MLLSTLERILCLKEVGLFSEVDGDHLVPMARRASEVRFPMGATLVRKGAAGDSLYVLVEGSVAVQLDGVEVGRRGRGEVIGEMAVLLRRPRSADCVAATEVLALKVRADDFWDLLSCEPGLVHGIVRVLATRLDEATAFRTTGQFNR